MTYYIRWILILTAVYLLFTHAGHAQGLDLSIPSPTGIGVIDRAPAVETRTLPGRYDWSQMQVALAASAVALQIADLGQTTYISRHADRWYETNPLIGRTPSTGRVRAMMIGSAVGMLVAAHYLPEWRTGILSVWIGVEGFNVLRNAHLGVGIEY